jgi:hypothetical protein
MMPDEPGAKEWFQFQFTVAKAGVWPHWRRFAS